MPGFTRKFLEFRIPFYWRPATGCYRMHGGWMGGTVNIPSQLHTQHNDSTHLKKKCHLRKKMLNTRLRAYSFTWFQIPFEGDGDNGPASDTFAGSCDRMLVRIPAHTHTYINAYMHICIRTYMHAYIHTYIHMHSVLMNTQFLTRPTCTQETKLGFCFDHTIKNTFLAIYTKSTNKLCTNISIVLCMYHMHLHLWPCRKSA